MPAQEREIVPQRQQFGLDRIDQCRRVAVGEVRPADRSLEQHVPHQTKPSSVVDVDEVSGRVAGAVQDVEGVSIETIAYA